MFEKNYKVLKEYNRAVDDLAKVNDMISTLQREKDYRLIKIEKEFEQKITKALNKRYQLMGLIKYIKDSVNKE